MIIYLITYFSLGMFSHWERASVSCLNIFWSIFIIIKQKKIKLSNYKTILSSMTINLIYLEFK